MGASAGCPWHVAVGSWAGSEQPWGTLSVCWQAAPTRKGWERRERDKEKEEMEKEEKEKGKEN